MPETTRDDKRLAAVCPGLVQWRSDQDLEHDRAERIDVAPPIEAVLAVDDVVLVREVRREEDPG